MESALPADGVNQVDMILPSDLVPAKASEMRDALLAWVEESEGTLKIDVTEGDLSPCALQLLVAVARTAAAQELDLTYASGAQSVLRTVDLD